MKTVFLIALVTSAIEMTACFICARQLWHMRRESKDRSRRMLAMGSLFTGLLAAFVLVLNVCVQDAFDTPIILPAWMGLIYMSMHIVMVLYPISVVMPEWLTPRHFFFLFLPTVVIIAAFLFFEGHWTELPTPLSVWENIGKPDVLVRLLALFAMLPYCFILFFLPYNYRQSSASFSWILNYSIGISTLCCVHIIVMLTCNPVLINVLAVLATLFYIQSTEYELEDRLAPSLKPGASMSDDEMATMPLEEEPIGELDLWSRISRFIDKEEVWQDPDLSLSSLAQLCATNVTYINRVIRQETGGSFKDLVKNKRITYVINYLQEKPDSDIQTAFFNAGYRSRATAWRNFKDIMGVTPTEFKQGME